MGGFRLKVRRYGLAFASGFLRLGTSSMVCLLMQLGLGAVGSIAFDSRVVEVGKDGEVLTQSFQWLQEFRHRVVATGFFGEKSLGMHSIFQADTNHAHGFDWSSGRGNCRQRSGQ